MSEMNKPVDFRFSRCEAACYSALVASRPSNGSQLSRISGIARSRIFDVLRNLVHKGLAFDTEPASYAPLPPEELKIRPAGYLPGDLDPKQMVCGGRPRQPAP